MSVLFIFLLALVTSTAQADAFDGLAAKPHVSYLVTTTNGAIIEQHDMLVRKAPASTQKLLTAVAAKKLLGGNYRFDTQFEVSQKASLKQGSLNQDLRLRMSGAPDFTRTQLRSMLKELKKHGVKRIQGDILINDAKFNGYHWSNGQSWNDLGVCYTSPSSAVILNRNCVQGNLSLGKDGETRLFIPKHEPLRIENTTIAVTAKEKRAQHCDLELNRGDKNHYQLTGCFVPRQKPTPMKFSINDPVTYFASILAAELKSLGIQHQGSIKREGFEVPEGQVLVKQRSASLDSLLSRMLKRSDNLIADVVFKTIGAVYYQQPGNFRNGGLAVKRVLGSAGIDLSEAILADGSGLSRHNLITVKQLVDVMAYTFNNDKQLGLINLLAVSGVDGTLQYRRSLAIDSLKGKVKAKTGSLKSVVNMVGVIETEKGPRLFAYLVSGYYLPAKQYKQYRQKLNPIRQFERDFFTQLLKQGKLGPIQTASQ
ncbi:D-alanyl-D-alanine carboxypeptidase/D-alanyl-D-alanine endopeptidase [Motilimonas pumila]|uniref:D-alanyl-D-alanine carboxypeptidase/D-alanyl-D-alanine-endopeptidase n=1 Tax=Motilimonas pumila TaxID=2303987 RepID=A0A418YII3_9GAMM|nr:D-alanyl-D-alanine carboxypeptidase/D-alanyl-D-alanine-endopeptidase [Motilimonas pumila]RJG50419.1 D-alanyl-D-alanine carboxypeptidase/D-alanyl-D-alanine-endopeptidase [Motilimonas pumila]